MSAWLWLLVAVVFLVIEITNLAFFAFFVAAGAAAAALASAAGGSSPVQVVVFAAVAIGGLALLRRLLIATFGHRRGGVLKSGVAGLVGQQATVVERIDSLPGVGVVHARGEDWPAITYDDQPCEPGQVVEVVDIDKTRLVVTAS
jgi:membrane protein implicated in regulation of membrane protease activity